MQESLHKKQKNKCAFSFLLFSFFLESPLFDDSLITVKNKRRQTNTRCYSISRQIDISRYSLIGVVLKLFTQPFLTLALSSPPKRKQTSCIRVPRYYLKQGMYTQPRFGVMASFSICHVLQVPAFQLVVCYSLVPTAMKHFRVTPPQSNSNGTNSASGSKPAC